MDKAEFVFPSSTGCSRLKLGCSGSGADLLFAALMDPRHGLARLGVYAMRGDVCIFCLWKSLGTCALDGMIWSACRK